MKNGIHVSITECENILNTVLRVTRDEYEFLRGNANDRNVQDGCLNVYDVRLRDSYPSCGMAWPPDLADVTPYLRVISLEISVLTC